MATLTIRNVDEDLKARLRVRAAENGRSMEEEVRAILRSELTKPSTGGVATLIHQRFADVEEDLVEDFIRELPQRNDQGRPVEFPE